MHHSPGISQGPGYESVADLEPPCRSHNITSNLAAIGVSGKRGDSVAQAKAKTNFRLDLPSWKPSIQKVRLKRQTAG